MFIWIIKASSNFQYHSIKEKIIDSLKNADLNLNFGQEMILMLIRNFYENDYKFEKALNLKFKKQ